MKVCIFVSGFLKIGDTITKAYLRICPNHNIRANCFLNALFQKILVRWNILSSMLLACLTKLSLCLIPSGGTLLMSCKTIFIWCYRLLLEGRLLLSFSGGCWCHPLALPLAQNILSRNLQEETEGYILGQDRYGHAFVLFKVKLPSRSMHTIILCVLG